MRNDCTQAFLRYRELARVVWNIGFWPIPELREWPFISTYEEAMARLFEGMILLPNGYDEKIIEKHLPGNKGDFRVIIGALGGDLMVNKHLPAEPGGLWGNPTIHIEGDRDVNSYQLRFLAFFDWSQQTPRDYRFIRVLIERMDDREDLLGRHAIVDTAECSILGPEVQSALSV